MVSLMWLFQSLGFQTWEDSIYRSRAARLQNDSSANFCSAKLSRKQLTNGDPFLLSTVVLCYTYWGPSRHDQSRPVAAHGIKNSNKVFALDPYQIRGGRVQACSIWVGVIPFVSQLINHTCVLFSRAWIFHLLEVFSTFMFLVEYEMIFK